MSLAASIAGAQPQEFFWGSAVLLALVGASFVASFAFLRRTRLMEDLPTSRVRSAAQGYIELEGVARLMDGEPVVSPLTGAGCAWWSCHVEEKRKDAGDRSTRWVTIDERTSDDCFLLDDGSGACIVDPAGADVIPALTRTWYGYAARPDIGPEAGRGWWRALWCSYRYTEKLILTAAKVYAIGSFRTQTGLADAVDEATDLRDLLAKWQHDPRMMALFDVNKDGVVDQKEWEAARRAAREQVRREQVERSVQTPDLNILGKPRDRRPFIISGIPQAQLIRRYRSYAVAAIGACTFLAGFGLWAARARGLIG